MSSTVTKLASGDTIHIRTGIIQGIGPEGPTGPTGPVGPQGERGAQGEKGETGYVSQECTLVTASGTQSLPGGNVGTLVAFDTVLFDDLSTRQSSTNYTPGAGNFYISVYVRFNNTDASSTGIRAVELLQAGVVVAADSRPMLTDTEFTDISFAMGVRITNPADVISVRVYNTDPDAIAIQNARMWISPHGPGVQGPPGPQGPIGPVGATGIQGPAGPSGAGTLPANTTFAQLAAG